MIKTENPYRPGAGVMPMYLAGRKKDIEEMSRVFDSLLVGIPVQSVIYTGLRGVGKTVLLNTFNEIAQEKGIFCKHIEVETRNDFIAQIISCAQGFLRQISNKEKLKVALDKCLDALKTLSVSFNPNENTFSISAQEQIFYKVPSLTQSLTDVFTSLGETAKKANQPICFFVDEVQYMKENELSSLIAALHRSNQLGYPIMMIGAGLPKIIAMLANEKSYSERLFSYKRIGSLADDEAKAAIITPVKSSGVTYTEDAISEIIAITKNYPFFIQQLCQILFENGIAQIGIADVKESENKFFHVLDTGFFDVRYSRCTDGERVFIFAMVKCGELPCTIQNVAKNMKKTVNAISTTRAQLISKGIIYSVRFKELDFTVPEFDGFIRRNSAYQDWCGQTGK